MRRASSLRRLEASVARHREAPPPEGAGLYQTVDEQIAVVRGRTPGKPSRGLLLLEDRLLRSASRPTTVTRRFDGGQAITEGPTASGGSPGTASSTGTTARSFGRLPALAPLWEPSTLGGPVLVEPFDEPTSAPAPASSLPVVLVAPGAALPTLAPPRQEPAPIPPEPACRPAPEAPPPPRAALSAGQRAAAEAFAKDIAGLLGGGGRSEAPEDATWNKTMVDAADPAGVAPARVAAPTSPAAPATVGHGVFDQMGAAMRYANSFDLGAVDLDARLDAIERELPRQPTHRVSSTGAADARSLSVFDVLADLAEIGTPVVAHSAAPSVPVPEPATVPNTSGPSEETSHG